MTVSERAFPQNLREKLAQRKLPDETPDPPALSPEDERDRSVIFSTRFAFAPICHPNDLVSSAHC